jgi:hypothetical protein
MYLFFITFFVTFFVPFFIIFLSLSTLYRILTSWYTFNLIIFAGIAASQWAHEYLGNLSSSGSSADITDADKYKTTAVTLRADTTAALRGVLLLAGSAIPYNFKETPQHRALPFMQVIIF